jgi:GDP-L-fucose synthase
MGFWQGKTIVVTGGSGFIGSHVVEKLQRSHSVHPTDLRVPRSGKHDLRVFRNCVEVLQGADIVIHLASSVGSVEFNQRHPASQYYDCNLINLQVLEAARQVGVEKFVGVSCACAYPKDVTYPLQEDMIHEGLPEPSHLGYGLAKRQMIVQASTYREQYDMDAVTVIPVNSYGPRDNYDLIRGHVIPALIRKCFEENELVVWGDGSAQRDFLYVEDLSEGIVTAAEHLHDSRPINLAAGTAVSISGIVENIVKLTGFQGSVSFDKSMPNGQPLRVADISRAEALIGFKPRYSLEEGLKKTINWYQNSKLSARSA